MEVLDDTCMEDLPDIEDILNTGEVTKKAHVPRSVRKRAEKKERQEKQKARELEKQKSASSCACGENESGCCGSEDSECCSDTPSHTHEEEEQHSHSHGYTDSDAAEYDDEERLSLEKSGLVLPRRQTKKTEEERKNVVGYDIPGTQKVYLKTFGCSHNQSDSEYMAGLLTSYGYSVTEKFDENSDAYIVNSCTVKGPSESGFMNLVTKAKATGKPVIVAGCVPQGSPNNKSWEGLSVIGVQQINRVVEVVEESIRGNTVKLLGRSKKNKPGLDLPKIRRNPFIEIVPINVGCLNQCTYCKTKHARGQLSSWDPDEIVSRISTVIEEGVKEIRMTSEDTGAYGRDIGTNIAELLNKIVPTLPDGVMLRVGMTNPPYILEHLDAICEILNHPRVYSFLHLPVQAASNNVLENMKREYTLEDFMHVCDTLIAKVPGVTIATDIICGFPGETEEDFEETLKLIERYKFPIVNISQFYPRPGTPAAQMKRVPTDVVKERSRKLTRLFESYTVYDHMKGLKNQRVWITEKAADKHHLVGHTKGYVQVLIDPEEAEVGESVYVDIVATSKWSVTGKVVNPKKKKQIQEDVKKNNANPWVLPAFLGATSLLVLFTYLKNK